MIRRFLTLLAALFVVCTQAAPPAVAATLLTRGAHSFTNGVDPYWDQVVMLAPLTGGAATNSKTKASLTTSGSPTLFTTGGPFSTGYIGLSTTQYASATLAGCAFGTGAFTIEGWVNLSSGGAYQTIWTSRGVGEANAFWFGIDSANRLTLFDDTAPLVTDPAAVSVATWYYVAVTRRANGDMFLFKNGTQVASLGGNTFNATQTTCAIGYSIGDTALGLNGGIAGIRITKGVARYTAASFTTPTRMFPNH